MIEMIERIAFLKKIPLFHDLDDDDLQLIAEEADEMSVSRGGVIFQQGGRADSFFMIYRGKVKMTSKRNGKEKYLTSLKNYDYFGETDLVVNRWRSSTVTALMDTSLLILSRENFHLFYQEISKLKRKRLYGLIFIKTPQIIGQFILDILGRDKASVTTALILGWLIIIGLLLFALNIISPKFIIDIWHSYFPASP